MFYFNVPRDETEIDSLFTITSPNFYEIANGAISGPVERPVSGNCFAQYLLSGIWNKAVDFIGSFFHATDQGKRPYKIALLTEAPDRQGQDQGNMPAVWGPQTMLDRLYGHRAAGLKPGYEL